MPSERRHIQCPQICASTKTDRTKERSDKKERAREKGSFPIIEKKGRSEQKSSNKR